MARSDYSGFGGGPAPVDPQIALDEEKKRKSLMASALRQDIGGATLAAVSDPGAQLMGRQMMKDSRRDVDRYDEGLAKSKAAAARGKGGGDWAHKMSNTRMEKIEKEAASGVAQLALMKRLKGAGNEGNMPYAGTLRKWRSKAGGMGLDPEDEMKEADWRAWDQAYSLRERHELFGSALTATESALWNAANINRDQDSSVINMNLRNQEMVLQQKLGQKVLSLMGSASGKEGQMQWVYDQYGEALPDEYWENPREWLAANRQDMETATETLNLENIEDDDLEAMIAAQEREAE